ncbi:hypothetical protein OAQ48_00505 [Candidatus Pelagibacter sp.]|jgi:hypothetical protein|nr:hypothetical protein [Candidatus Pelagibacter sp.]
MIRKLLLILVIYITGCGYQPIYVNKNIDLLEFSKITLIGDNEINRKIINSLNIKENKTGILGEELVINTSFKIEETSKNSKGQVISYRSSANVNLEITKEKNVISNKTFVQNFTYSNRDNKFDLVEYQNEVKSNISNKIIEEIILFINLE